MDDEIEATKIINPLTEANTRIFLDRLYKKLRTSVPVTQYQGADVHMFGDDEIGYVVLVNKGEIIYFVRHRRISHNALRLGRQVLLWRNKNEPRAAGFAKLAFFHFLLPRYGALISDKEQTRDGARFWSSIMAYSLGRYKVYFLDRRRNPTKLIALESFDDIDQYKDDIWGTQAQHIYTFAVISNKPLKLK